MSRHKCTKELYKSFLQASSMRYSGLALSEVIPLKISHDAISRWLSEKHFRPRDLWLIAKDQISPSESCLLIADDTVLAKTRSQKIELVNYQYSGNAHDVYKKKAIYTLLGLTMEGQKEILGLYLSEQESASYWLSILAELQNRVISCKAKTERQQAKRDRLHLFTLTQNFERPQTRV